MHWEEQLLASWQSLLDFQQTCKANLVNMQTPEGDLKDITIQKQNRRGQNCCDVHICFNGFNK